VSNRLPLSPLLRHLVTGLAWIALTTTFFFPTKGVMDPSLDYSNYGSYTYFTADGFKYGSDVVPMCGPYGFVMYGYVYNGQMFWLRFVAELGVKGILAALALWFFRKTAAAPFLRWVWIFSLVLCMGAVEDYPEDWLILLGGLWMISHTSAPDRRYRPAVMAAVLGFVALIKGTHLVLTLATLGAALLPALWRRDGRQIAAAVGAFAASLLGWWLVAGQRPGDLPAYVHGILELSSGYNNAMALDESMGTFGRGATLALLLLGLYAWGAVSARRHVGPLVSLALLAGFTFLKWKHGFVRSDGHIFIFFCFASVAASTWLLLLAGMDPAGPVWPARRHRLGLALSGGALVLALFGLGDGEIRRARWVYVLYPGWLRDKIEHLSNPAAAKARLDDELARRKAVHHLPATRQAVGTGRIDMFGVEHGVTLLNDLRYAPRPIGGGSFSTFTPYLIHLNGEFMADAVRRPDFFLLKLQTIDNRLAMQDDSLTFRGLLQHYTPRLVEQEYLLFERAPASTPIEPVPLATRRFAWNETIDVPAVPADQMLYASFSIRPSLYGRLRAALYKPPLVFVHQLGEKLVAGESRRLIPAMASVPFPVSPVIENNRDVVGLYTRKPGKTLYQLRLSTDHPAAFADGSEVTFYTAPRPPLPDRVDLDELTRFMDYPLTNVLPESIKPANEPRRVLSDVHVQMLMPPAELAWRLVGDERELQFDYGIDPEVFVRGQSNGVVFVVELRAPGAAPRELFRTLVDPRRAEDRRVHSARVALPPAPAGTRLVLRTEPGEFGDNAWDWSYVTKIYLQRGPHAPRPLPGFNRPPDDGTVEGITPVDLPDGRALQVHAPGELVFRLKGDERTLRFDYGFHPRAYTEGTTNGAVYRVELVRPNQPRTLLFERALDPRAHPADQGRQHAELSLPPLGPADTLILSIGAGPYDNAAWDWTYLTNFELK
jgi:hypothetical protein